MMKFGKSEFTRNALVLASGTTLAQAIPIALTPVLTRLYGPEDFGVLALFVAVVSILGTIASARYEIAIMLPDRDQDAINIAALCLTISAAICLLTVIPAVFFNSQIAELLGNDAISFWLYLVPVTSFLVATFATLNQLNTRLKSFKKIARAMAVKSLAMVGVQVSIGLAHAGPTGLVSGQIASHVVSNGALARPLLAALRRGAASWPQVRQMARRYRRFPALSLPAALSNVLALHATSILISLVYSIATLGHYALVQRLLGMPSALVGTAVGQVFYEQAARERREHGHAMKAFNGTIRKLTLLSVPTFGLIALAAPTLFAVILGEQWRLAGTYAQILAPLFAIRFVMATVSNVNNVFEQQGVALAWQVALLVLSVTTIGLAHLGGWSVVTFFAVYSITISSHYLLLYFIMRHIAQGGQSR